MHDLTTERGVLDCMMNLMEHCTNVFVKRGTLCMGVGTLATKVQGKRLPAPKLFVVLSDGQDIPGFLARTYDKAIYEHDAVGVVTFAHAVSVNIEDPAEVEAWRGRDLTEHPGAFRNLTMRLEHIRFGVRVWIARISKDGKIAPFESQTDDSLCQQGDFLDRRRSHPSVA